MVKVVPLLFLILLSIIFVSGCSTDTGKLTETSKLTTPELSYGQNQTTEDVDELHKEFAEFEKSQSAGQNKTENNSGLPQNGSESGGSGGRSKLEPQITRKCPPCNDSNPCTTDYCSKQTVYECVYEAIVPCCGNSVCEQEENWSACLQDCNKPECNLSCGTCELLDNETCSCMNITQCIPDGCCPSECSYTTDQDCPNPNICETNPDCDDSDPCTMNMCSGEPRNCSFPPVTECSQDGCCPANCAYPEDQDCPIPSVVFSEIYYSQKGGDDNHEWIEIYNNGTVSVGIIKWKFLEAGTNHRIDNISDQTILNPGSYAVIAQNSAQFISDYPNFTGTLFDASFSLNNTGEMLALKTGAKGEIIDSVSYNRTWGGYENNFSLEKIDLNGPNTAENWNQSLTEKGTPGQENSITA